MNDSSASTAREVPGESKPASETPPPERPATSGGRKVAGKILSIVIVFATIVLALKVWNIIEHIRGPMTRRCGRTSLALCRACGAKS
ncbi:MAG: hypothetical protein WDN28_07500 [Chthoniobacter sp.]